MTKETISSSPSIKPLLYLNVHVALIAWGFLLSAARWRGIDPAPALQLLVFCAALAVYGLDRTGGFSPEDRRNAPDRCAWLTRHRALQTAVILLALLGLLLALTRVSTHTRLTATAYVLFAAAYARPLLPGKKRLQDFPRLKLPCIVLGWALLPALNPDLFSLPWTLYRVLWLIPNVLWSEWLDHPGDHQTDRPAPPLRASLLLLAATLLYGLHIQAGPDLPAPALYTLALLLIAPRRPLTFARCQDLLLLTVLLM
ncbi:MAG: hypothetical protein JJU05_16430 [Verrucomicrobia bacterium]|nr:hypothetical protein [Verrucomicrobiota bacterium]MCH8527901.1 hypothetical protein [Kiritimatiellia bacterium]